MIRRMKTGFLFVGIMTVFLGAVGVGAFGDESFRRQQFQADDGFKELDEEFAEPEPVKPTPPKIIIKERVIIREKLVPVPRPAPLEHAPVSKPSTRGRIVVSHGYRFDFQSCTLSNRNIECDVMVRTPNDDKTLTLYSHYSFRKLSSSAFDNLGNQYYPSSTLLGNKDSRAHSNRSITGRLIQGISTKIKVFFENVSSETASISMLELHAEDNGKKFKVQFRDIPFSG